ncbi:hypothetical protein LCGC14_1442470, partial [marine sediment metagenome]
MKTKWTVVELRRFDRILLQISHLEDDEYQVIGTITIDDTDMESREAWQKAIEEMNKEYLQ